MAKGEIAEGKVEECATNVDQFRYPFASLKHNLKSESILFKPTRHRSCQKTELTIKLNFAKINWL